MTQTDSAYSAYVHCEPNGVSLVGSGGVARLAAGCVLALMLAFPNAAVADAEPEDVSGDSALLLDNVDVLSSASISTLTPATIGKGERWTVPASGEMHPVVTIGVPDTADLGRERPMMISTIERLSRAMPGTQFRLRVILSADGNAQLNIVSLTLCLLRPEPMRFGSVKALSPTVSPRAKQPRPRRLARVWVLFWSR